MMNMFAAESDNVKDGQAS